MEFVAELYKPRRVKRALKVLSELQNILGAINDTEVAAQKIKKALRGRTREQIKATMLPVQAWNTSNLKILRRKLSVAWEAYSEVNFRNWNQV